MKTNFVVFAVLLFVYTGKAQTGILNGGFENTFVNTQNDTVPNDWELNQNGAGMTTDAHSGNSAVSVWKWYYYIPGVIANGNGGIIDMTKGGTPISFAPTKLTGYYKYIYDDNGNNTDSSYAEVVLYKYNSSSNARDTIAYGTKKLGPASSYIPFEVELNYLNNVDQADTISVRFSSSLYGGGSCINTSDGNCCYLYLDDISVSSVTGIQESISLNPVLGLYPNPSNGKFIIQNDEIQSMDYYIEIYNVMGERIYNKAYVKGQSSNEIDIFAYPKGTYFIKMSYNGKVRTEKILVQ